MNDDQLNNMFAAARRAPRDTERAEFAFETRLLARLRTTRETSGEMEWLVWTRRLVPVFAAIVLALGAWNFIALNSDSTDLHSAIAAEHDDIALLSPFDEE